MKDIMIVVNGAAFRLCPNNEAVMESAPMETATASGMGAAGWEECDAAFDLMTNDITDVDAACLRVIRAALQQLHTNDVDNLGL